MSPDSSMDGVGRARGKFGPPIPKRAGAIVGSALAPRPAYPQPAYVAPQPYYTEPGPLGPGEQYQRAFGCRRGLRCRRCWRCGTHHPVGRHGRSSWSASSGRVTSCILSISTSPICRPNWRGDSDVALPLPHGRGCRRGLRGSARAGDCSLPGFFFGGQCQRSSAVPAYWSCVHISSAPVKSAEATRATGLVQPNDSLVRKSTIPVCVVPLQAGIELCSMCKINVLPGSSSV